MLSTLRRTIPAMAVGVACAAASAPASAILQLAADVNGVTFTCFDNQAGCDTNPALGILALGGSIVVNGVEVQGSTHTSINGAVNLLTSSSITVSNISGVVRDILVAVGDTDFVGPASFFDATGSGTFVQANGSSIDMLWFNDPANQQGADFHLDLPGNLVHNFSHTSVGPLSSYSTDTTLLPLLFPDPGLFSMTLHFDISLTPGGSLISRGQALLKPQDQEVPEPASLVLLGIGLAAVGLMRRKYS